MKKDRDRNSLRDGERWKKDWTGEEEEIMFKCKICSVTLDKLESLHVMPSIILGLFFFVFFKLDSSIDDVNKAIKFNMACMEIVQ